MEIITKMLIKNENLEEDLVNLLGFENLESISFIILNKELLLKNSQNEEPNVEQQKVNRLLPHVYAKQCTDSVLTEFKTKFSLPIGTIKDDCTQFERFTAPAAVNESCLQYNIPIVKISSFSEASQKAFQVTHILMTLFIP